MDSIESLDAWEMATVPAVLAISSELRATYSGQRLEHFRRVARAVLERFGDPQLARAAFLHGVHPADFVPALSELVGPQVLTLLRSRATLRSLDDFEDHKLPERLVGNLLPSFKDPRPAVLLVLDQLDHVDPTGAVAKWTVDSYERLPRQLPQYQMPSLAWTRFSDTTAQLSFVASVVEPTARFFGLRHEGRVAANVELLHRDPERFSALYSYLRHSARRGGEVDAVLRHFRSVLAAPEARWEWRALGEIDRVLPRQVSLTRRDLQVTGSVLLLVNDDEQAFALLRDLHRSFVHHRESLRDHLTWTPMEETAAIRSRVLLPRETFESRLVEEFWIEAEIAKRSSVGMRRASATRLPQLWSAPRGLTTREATSRARQITVFTPHGLHVVLPRGATVLNFAYAVHNHFIVLARRARVNRRYVELSSPLADGDVIWLEVGDIPQPLSKAWRQHVAPETVAKIFKKYKQVMRPELQRGGVRALRLSLADAGCPVEELHHRLDEFVGRAGSQLMARRVVPRIAGGGQEEPAWWYQQLAMLEYEELGQAVPFRLVLNAKTRVLFVEEVARLVLADTCVDLADLVVPAEVKRLAPHARLCLLCRPSLAGSLLGEVEQGELVLHRSGTTCRVSSTALVVHGRPGKVDFYVLRTINRTGLAADVFRVFAEVGAEIVDVAATRVGAREGVFRVQLEHLTPEVREELHTRLEKLPGVTALKRPGGKRIAEEMLGGPLPPRRSIRALDEGLEDPFFCGDKIVDDGFFYGMRDQKATLRKYLQVAAGQQQAGIAVWIRGAKKVGKSSLALSFIRDATNHGDGVAEYIEAERGESWTSLAERLLARLTADHELQQPRTITEALRCRLRQVDRPLMLVIDEAVNLLLSTVSRGEIERLLEFRTQMSSCPGVLLVWIGPIANVDGLPSAAKHLLQSSLRINVPPLEEPDIESMLTCERLTFPCVLTAEEGLAAYVRHLTAGNPFWVAHLGRAMWEICRRRGRTNRVHFDLQLLREAERMVCGEEIPFQDRLESEHWSRTRKALARKLLAILAKHAGRRVRAATMKTLSTADIESALGPIPKSSLKKILKELESRGSVISEPSKRGPLWRLSAPILADHLAPPEWFSQL